MPELPDLQVFRRNLHKMFAGKKLKEITVKVTRKLKVPSKTIKEALENQLLKSVSREGKELHFEFKNGNILGLHLMLHGELHLFEQNNDNKNTILEMLFDDDTGIALIDWQKMATPTLNPETHDAPDALSKEVTVKFIREQLQKTRSIVKNVLLDQRVIRGIGNAYADEILWDAKISPFSVSNKIPEEKIRHLVKSIRKVLTSSEQQILKVNPDRITGELRDFLLIHHSKKEKSPTGAVILKKSIGTRKTYYTDEQELYR